MSFSTYRGSERFIVLVKEHGIGYIIKNDFSLIYKFDASSGEMSEGFKSSNTMTERVKRVIKI